MKMEPIGQHLVAVHLYAGLAEKYGALHYFAIRTPTEAVAALDANYPGFITDFKEHEHYALLVDGDWRVEEQCHFPISKEVHFCPMIEGRAFLGALAIGAIFPAIAGTATATILGGLLVSALMFGISLLLAPKQKKNSGTTTDDNYAFSGPENVTEQGAPVPLIYGRVHAGSVVVSAGLELDTEYTAAQVGGFSLSGGEGFSSLAMFRVAPDLDEPVGGWPPLVDGPKGKYPLGWDFAESQVNARDNTVKTVNIYVSPVHPVGEIYAWSEASGFYVFKTHAEREELPV